ncbi:MAG: hypothetical protein WCO28_02445 [Bacteroidota bacterium]
MKVLLDIKENKAAFVLELLNNLTFVKVEPLSPYKEEVLKGIKKGVDEINSIRAGKLKGISARTLLNEI